MRCDDGHVSSSVELTSDIRASRTPFQQLDGWETDDHERAFEVFQRSAKLADHPSIRALSQSLEPGQSAKSWFEQNFQPILVDGPGEPLFTGYYEPEIEGAREKSAERDVPVYRLPPPPASGKWPTRKEITEGGAFASLNLELAWVKDAVELFFLQVQGSGRIRLEDGTVIRIGYAGTNGHGYRSIGQELVRRGELRPAELSAQAIKAWAARQPDRGCALLTHNPAYVFFRELDLPDPRDGPIGAMGCSVTPSRSIAVDPDFVPLGLPVWIDIDHKPRPRRLTIAQDTGSAIKGPGRADLFLGSGAVAEETAGRMRHPGRMVILVPHEMASRWLGGGVGNG